MVGNPSSPIDGLAVDMYMEDIDAPFLEEFSIDMNIGELYLTFSETVDVSSINTSAFTLQYDSNVSYSNPMAFHTFASDMTIAITSDVVDMLDNKIVIIDIAQDDLNEIKRKTIANSRSRTWLTVIAGGLMDSNFRSVLALPNGYAKQAVNYTEDETYPVLESYQISLNDGYIHLFFSETVDVRTLNVLQITLYNTRSVVQSAEFHILTNSSVYKPEVLSVDGPGNDTPSSGMFVSGAIIGSGNNVSDEIGASSYDSFSGSGSGISVDMNMFNSLSSFNSPTIKLYFSHFDLNTIKALTGLANSATTTYLRFRNDTIADMVGNYFVETNTSNLFAVSNYTKDTTSPRLRMFSFDLDGGVLTLTFTETVNISSVDVTQQTLISSVCGGTNFTLNAVPEYPNTSIAIGADRPLMLVKIGHEDLDAIKNLRSLFTKRSDSLLYLTDMTIHDNAGNRVVDITSCEAPRVREFIPDTTPPELRSFDLDLDDGRLILTFSETVQIINSLNVSGIILQTQPSSLESYTLTNFGPFRSSSIDSDNRIVTIMIGFYDLNAIKYNIKLATSKNNTFVFIENGTVLDHASNECVSTILPVRIFTPDRVSPILVNYTLNMDSTTLILTFNETVNSSSLSVNQITIQNSMQSSSVYHSSPLTLTPGINQTYTSSDNDYVVIIHLGPTDRNEIKKRRNLAVSNNTTYLRLTQYAITDMNYNFLVPIEDGSALQVSRFIEDDTPPSLANFSVDMNVGQIYLTFDETVMSASLMPDAFTLQDSLDDPMQSIQISTRGIHSVVDSTILTIFVDVDDLNEIKRLMICREAETCFLAIEDGAVLDMVEISIESSNGSVQVAEYISDTNRPALIRFDTNLTSQIVTLTFNETVDASSINFTAFTFQDFFEATTTFTLSDAYLLSNDSTVIEFLFDLNDLNSIKRNTDLLVNRFSTWITITQFAIQDLANMPNYIVPIVDTTDLTRGLVTQMFYPDLINPQVIDFDLNLTSNDLTIFFSETVLARSFNVQAITLQSTPNRSDITEWYTLQPGQLPIYSTLSSQSNTDFHILAVKLGQVDTNAIKALSHLATDPDNTYLSITSDLVEDMSANAIDPIPITEAKQVRLFGEDEIRPYLSEFRLDLNTGQLVLIFSETVNASSLLVQHIRMQSMPNTTIYWPLTPRPTSNASEASMTNNEFGSGINSSSGMGSGLGSGSNSSGLGMDSVGMMVTTISPTDNNAIEMNDPFAPYYSFTNGTDSHIVIIQLGFTDLNRLKKLTDIATDNSNTFISLTPEAISDMNMNMVNEVSSSDAKMAVDVVRDMIRPRLVFFTLNLTSEVLSLTFNEIVNASSLQVNAITLQESNLTHLVMIVSRFMLTGGNGSDANDYIIHIQLNNADLNQIKKLDRISTSQDNTYIAIMSNLIVDMNNNRVLEILDGFGLQADVFYNDFVRPKLDSFILDMDDGLLHLTFSETMEAASFNVTQIILQDASTDLMNRRRQFTTDSRLEMIYNDPVLSVELGECDLNFIKVTEMFGFGTNDTYIVISEMLITDTNGNPVEPILNGEAKRAFNYIPDTTRPFLIDYHLDFIAEEMSLNFNEPMNVSMINFTSITLQDDINPEDSYTLTGGNATAFNKSLTIVIAFNEVDISFFKAHKSLTTSVLDTYITFTSHSFYDVATYPNPVNAIIGQNASQVSTFTYYNAPIYTSIKPIAGRQSGGTLFQIDGGYLGDFFGELGFREIDVLIDNSKAVNVSILKFNVSMDGYTPSAGNLIGVPVLLTITIDNSALMINISEAFTYLAPPIINRIFPTSGSRFGGRIITIFGENYGPPSNLDSPSVTVDISGTACLNVTVVNNTLITCVSPALQPNVYNLTATVDGVSVTIDEGYSSVRPPTVNSVSPNTTFRYTPTAVNITGNGFGPSTASGNAIVVQVFLVSDFNTTECSGVVVAEENILITCLAEPNLGPSQVFVYIDGVESRDNVTFIHYDNAGSFAFEKTVFSVSEIDNFANISVIRSNASLFPSPVSVSIQAFEGTAKSGSHFIASNQSVDLTTNQSKAIFQIRITYQAFESNKLRKGEEDDVELNLRIADVTAMHGKAYITNNAAILRIKAICEVVSHLCIADWNVIDSNVIYYRIDELP